jgi:hypothetical protein
MLFITRKYLPDRHVFSIDLTRERQGEKSSDNYHQAINKYYIVHLSLERQLSHHTIFANSFNDPSQPKLVISNMRGKRGEWGKGQGARYCNYLSLTFTLYPLPFTL